MGSNAENNKGERLAGLLDVAKHPEFTEAELNNLYKLFTNYSKPADTKGSIDLDGLKKLLEILGLTQTHLESKATYDKYAKDGAIKLDQYMRLVKDMMEKNGKINLEMVVQLAAQEEVKVEDIGVGGAKRFFEAKARVLEVGDAAYRAFEDKKKEEEDRKMRQEEFRKKREAFQTPA